MRIQHLVITRFNVVINRDDNSLPSSEWLEQRMRLFEMYCLPSIKAQTCQNFKWLILMSESTPKDVRNRMEQFQKQVPMIQVIYIGPIKNITTFYHQLAFDFAEGSPYILTTRLDNDDVVAPTYIADIQRVATSLTNVPTVLSFPHGCQLFINDSVGLGLFWRLNHFISMLERLDDTTHTVLDFDHTQISHKASIHCENTVYPVWGELVHGGNVSNNYTPHNHPRVERWKELPFPGEWKAYLSYRRNWKYLILYHLRYRKGSVRNLFKRFAR